MQSSPPTQTPTHVPTTTVVTNLTTLFPTQTHPPGSAAYIATTTTYYDASSISAPALVFHPHTSHDVAAALKLLTASNTKFAVKGGGHMPGAFSSAGEGGVLMAMERMEVVEWEDQMDGVVLRVGPGNRWGRVYAKAAERGRVVVGGRRPEVGVVGLVIGGGVAFVAGEYGWACDNVAGFEVVLADSTIVYATATNDHKDLYRALRGGSANFGIVTRIDLITHPLPNGGWGALNFHDFSSAPELRGAYIAAFIEYILHGASADPKSGAVTVLLCSPMAGMNAGYSNLWRSSPEPTSSLSSSSTTTPAVFKALNTIPSSSKHGNITLSEFIESLGAASPPSPIPMQNAFRTSTFLADAALIKEFVRVHDEEYAAIVNVVGLTTALTFQPITPRHVRAAENGIGRNVLGLEDAAEKGTLVVTEQSVSWMHAEDRERVQAVQKRIQERMEVWAVERRLHVGWRYLNDADMDQNDAVWEGIGEDNGRFLRAVRERYDKEGVLRRLWVGGFKL